MFVKSHHNENMYSCHKPTCIYKLLTEMALARLGCSRSTPSLLVLSPPNKLPLCRESGRLTTPYVLGAGFSRISHAHSCWAHLEHLHLFELLPPLLLHPSVDEPPRTSVHVCQRGPLVQPCQQQSPHSYTRTHAHVYPHTRTHARTHTCTHTTCAYTHTHAHTHKHTPTRTHTRT